MKGICSVKYSKYLIFILCIVQCTILTSCSNHTPTQDDFSLSIVNSETVVTANETITFVAVLKNSSSNKYTLQHGIPLIGMYIHAPDEEHEGYVHTSLVETKISENESITKSANFKFTEKGKYILEAFSSFSVNGREYRLTDTIQLIVE